MRQAAVLFLIVTAGCGPSTAPNPNPPPADNRPKHDYQGWKIYAPAGGGFEVRFPQEPVLAAASPATGNLHVAGEYQRRGVATWLLGQAASWLDLAQVDNLLDYCCAGPGRRGHCDPAGYQAFLAAAGFRELSRTRRGWTRTPPRPAAG